MRKSVYYLLFCSLFLSCQEQMESLEMNKISKEQSHNEEINDPIGKVSAAHAKSDFLHKKAVKFDLQLFFGGKERMNGTMTLLTNSTKGIIELKNGSTIIYDNGKVFHSPGIENEEKVRFDAYTWSYFFLFPFKLEDKGTNWSDITTGELNGETYNQQKLTFESGTGDAPDDWYIMYSDQKTNLIRAAAYIVTLNKPREEAEKDPHAIEYKNYKRVDGIPFATEWTFWGWNATDGLTGELGNAAISNIEFVSDVDGVFEIPADYLEK